MLRLQKSEGSHFTSGAPIWILPELQKSAWAQKIDWYLNFQLLRARDHESPKMADGFVQLMREWDVKPPIIKASNGHLMIASFENLPNEMVVQIPFDDPQNWLKECVRVCESLKRDRARIFLPHGTEAKQFMNAAAEKLGAGTLTFDFVEDVVS